MSKTVLRLCVVASAVSFGVSFTLPAQSAALRQAAKAAISTVQATHALFSAAAVGDRVAVVRWLAVGADPRAKNDDGKLPFQVAIEAEHDALTAILLKTAGGIDARDEQGWTPLNWAILSGDWQLVRAFIREDADISVGHQNALVVAKLMESEMQLLEIIIAEKGVNAKFGKREETLMTLAARAGHNETVAMLIDGGAELNVKGGWGNSALLLAAAKGHTETVAMLIEGGADLNVKGGWNASALLLAARGGHTEIVKLLIARGAELNARDFWNKTALDTAEQYGHEEIAAILRAAATAIH